MEYMVFRTVFGPEHADVLAAVLSKHFSYKSVGEHGTSVPEGFQRGSGGMDTTLGNTLLSAIIHYTTLRESGASKEEAYSNLGLFTGDDAVAAANPEVYTKVASKWGQQFVCEVFERGDIGVNFLARVYGPEVWNGNPESMCDLKRQLGKIHLSANKTLTSLMKLTGKLIGYAADDVSTPVISELVQAFYKAWFKIYGDYPNLAMHPELVDKDILKYDFFGTLGLEGDVHYPSSSFDSWKMEIATKALRCEKTGNSFDFKLFERFLVDLDRDPMSTPHDFLRMPCCLELAIPELPNTKVGNVFLAGVDAGVETDPRSSSTSGSTSSSSSTPPPRRDRGDAKKNQDKGKGNPEKKKAYWQSRNANGKQKK
jgi:hypothetical protein